VVTEPEAQPWDFVSWYLGAVTFTSPPSNSFGQDGALIETINFAADIPSGTGINSSAVLFSSTAP